MTTKKIIFLSYSILFSLCIIAQEKPKTKKISKSRVANMIHENYSVLKDNPEILEGEYKQIYKNKTLTKGTYKNNLREGIWEFKDFKNELNFSGYYTNGKKNGKWEYYSHKILSSILYYTNDKLDSCISITEKGERNFKWVKTNNNWEFIKGKDLKNNENILSPDSIIPLLILTSRSIIYVEGGQDTRLYNTNDSLIVKKGSWFIRKNNPFVFTDNKPLVGKAKNENDIDSISISAQGFYKLTRSSANIQIANFQNGKDEFYRFFLSNVFFPSSAEREHKQGLSIIEFTYNENGELESTKMLKSIGSEFDYCMNLLVKDFPRFNPGLYYGIPVKTKIILPIEYKLSWSSKVD